MNTEQVITDPVTSDTADREMVLTRTFDAPRELVWRAWTEEDQLVQWWGPDGFTNTFYEMSVRPGGVWRFMMHGWGQDWPNKIIYREVVAPERLVFDHGEDGADESTFFHVTVTFADRAGKTELTMRHLFPTVEAKRETEKFGAVEAGYQTLAKLAAHLETMR